MTTIGSGQVASGSAFGGFATISVTNGGTIEASTITHAFVKVFSGGSATGNTVTSGSLTTESGAVTSATTANAGGLLVLSAGTTYADVLQHGTEDIYSGGRATGTVVSSGGVQFALAGGSAVLTSVYYGAGLSASSGGTVVSAQILAGGSLEAAAGATLDATTVHAGGVVGAAAGDVVNSLTIDGGSAYANAESITGSVAFTANGGALFLQDTSAVAATVSGFGAGATIDISGLVYANASAATLLGNVLTVTEGGSVEHLTIDPTGLVSSDFVVIGDALGNSEIVFHCFRAGTGIATPAGDIAVEHLRAGDPVRLADGRVLPVRWLARQRVARRFADPVRAWPVRIAAGALGGKLPVRDLEVSPGHALLLDDVLVQAGALVGLPGIARAADVPEVFDYWHVELDEHALLLAEGVAAESYLEGAETFAFDNRGDRPAPAEVTEMAWPRVKAARQLPAALRARLGGRAAA